MSGRARSIILSIVGILVGAGFLGLALRDVQLRDVYVALASANYLILLLGVLSFIAFFVVKSLRWSFLLRGQQKLSTSALMPATIRGYALNLLVPHLGEIYRSHSVARSSSVSLTSVLSTILVERMMDFLAVGFFLAVSLTTVKDVSPELTQAGNFLLVMIGLLVAIVFLYKSFFLAARALIEKFLGFFGKKVSAIILPQLDSLHLGLSASVNKQTILAISLLSILQWALIVVCIGSCIYALGVDVPFVVSWIVLALTIAGLTLPTAPGYVGTIQLCFVIAFAQFGVESSTAVAAGLLYNLIIVIPVIPMLAYSGPRVQPQTG